MAALINMTDAALQLRIPIEDLLFLVEKGVLRAFPLRVQEKKQLFFRQEDVAAYLRKQQHKIQPRLWLVKGEYGRRKSNRQGKDFFGYSCVQWVGPGGHDREGT